MPQWITPSGFLCTATEYQSTSVSVIATGTGIIYSLISGKLPNGLNFSNGTIAGTPGGVLNTQRSTFVIRARDNLGVTDRTFFIDTEGADPPQWNTPFGYLPVGYNGEGYAFTNQYIKINVSASSVQPENTNIKYFLSEGSGLLPQGITLNQDGVISGFVEEKVNLGDPPNRFTFEVSATDGISTSSRFFRIIVVPPDYFKADNQYLSFSTTFITSTASSVFINSGTSIFTLGENLPNTFDLNLVNVFDLVSYNSVLPFESRVESITTNSFVLNTSTKVSISTGTTISIYRPKYDFVFDIISGYAVTGDAGYLQPPQFLKGNSLGTIRSSNNYTLDVSAYDAAPFRGNLTYSLITGTSIFTQLPEGLTLDQTKGYIYGFIPYQPAYIRNYNLTISATKSDNLTGYKVTATNTFTLAIKGEVESSIEWVSDNDLGSIETGFTSELYVEARQILSNYSIKYQLSQGNLPLGLTLNRDGSISGKVEYGNTGTYFFKVIASDIYELSWIEREFKLTVEEKSNKEYTKIYVRPFLAPEKRKIYQEFITDFFTFDPKLIYRYNDSNFGIQPEIKIILEFGIEKIDLPYYVSALRENFYRKRFYFGDIKRAIARDPDGKEIYELIYVEPIDDMIDKQKNQSVSQVVYSNNEIYYPSSIENMRKQLRLIPLEDNRYISVNENLQPKFMSTSQGEDYRLPGYMRVIPICYTLPGQGSKVISRIKLSQFDFKLINFEIDRIIVENAADQNSAKYLIFDRQDISDAVETDNQLFGSDWAETPELTVRLDDENNIPINRK